MDEDSDMVVLSGPSLPGNYTDVGGRGSFETTSDEPDHNLVVVGPMSACGPPHQHSGLQAFKPIIDGIENDAVPGSVGQERVAAPHTDAGRRTQIAVSSVVT